MQKQINRWKIICRNIISRPPKHPYGRIYRNQKCRVKGHSSTPENRFLYSIPVNYCLPEKYFKRMMKDDRKPIQICYRQAYGYSRNGRRTASFKERGHCHIYIFRLSWLMTSNPVRAIRRMKISSFDIRIADVTEAPAESQMPMRPGVQARPNAHPQHQPPPQKNKIFPGKSYALA